VGWRIGGMKLQEAVKKIESLKPGEAIIFAYDIICDIGCDRLVGFFGPVWTPIDRIMENVVGSSTRILVTEDYINDKVKFYCLEEPLTDDRMTYVSPDRRDYYEKEGDFWARNDVPYRKR
jgi:hypothetical protein